MSLKRQSVSLQVSNHDKIPTWPSQQRHEAHRFVKPPILSAVAICVFEARSSHTQDKPQHVSPAQVVAVLLLGRWSSRQG